MRPLLCKTKNLKRAPQDLRQEGDVVVGIMILGCVRAGIGGEVAGPGKYEPLSTIICLSEALLEHVIPRHQGLITCPMVYCQGLI